MAATQKKVSISKPTLVAEALRFAVEPTERTGEGDTKVKGKKINPRASKAVSEKGTRIFFAPDGDKRLTINMREDLHKRLKIAAIEQGSTVGDILEQLVDQNL